MTPTPMIEALRSIENTYRIGTYMTDWARMFSYTAVLLCSFFAIKMNKITKELLVGNIIFSLFLTMGMFHIIIFSSNRISVSSSLLTSGAIIWMVFNFYNLFKQK